MLYKIRGNVEICELVVGDDELGGRDDEDASPEAAGVLSDSGSHVDVC
jgi:hypothetical protein